jgi:6-phosphogluconolactonase
VALPIQEERFASPAALEHALTDRLKEEFQTPSLRPKAVLLSGGRTPVPVYRALTEKPFPVPKTLYLAFTDERHVPDDSPDSNYGSTRPMIDALRIPPERVIRVHTSLPLGAAADRYHLELESFLQSGGIISFGLLGIGPDGHTCSLFGPADLARGEGYYACAVPRPTGPCRVSVTPALLQHVDRIVFAATGSDKESMLDQLLQSPESVTAGQAVARCRNVELWRA